MAEDNEPDYYEVLQISPNADPDTVHRVYRLLAQRFHPDNQSTGDADKFRLLTEAYQILGDPEQRAGHDVHRPARQEERSRLLSEAWKAVTDVEAEQLLRLTILELLYARRRTEPESPGISYLDLEGLVGQPREHIDFALWYLVQTKSVSRTDGSQITITVDGMDHLETHDILRKRVPLLTAGKSRAAV